MLAVCVPLACRRIGSKQIQVMQAPLFTVPLFGQKGSIQKATKNKWDDFFLELNQPSVIII